MKKGDTENVTMASMNAGQNCGACHDGKKEFGGKVAFDLKDAANCGKCHVK
jgi:c(7)-type cytochrome triheme protein